MSTDHERARNLALALRIEELPAADRDWLDAHLFECAACREYHESVELALGSVRSLAATAGDLLVRSTQMRVRQRAAEIQARQALMRPLWLACALVVVSSIAFTPLLWEAFAWIGRAAQLSDFAWRSGFVLFWFSPAMAASFLLLASGSYAARWREAHIFAGGQV